MFFANLYIFDDYLLVFQGAFFDFSFKGFILICMTPLTSLDVLIIVSTIVIAGVGVYLILILRRFAHMSRVADRFAHTIEKFQDAFAIIDRIPTEMIRRVTDNLPRKK